MSAEKWEAVVWEQYNDACFKADLEAVILAMLEIGFDDDEALELALGQITINESQKETVVLAALCRLGAMQIFLSAACAEQEQVSALALSGVDRARVARGLAWLRQSPDSSTGRRFAWDLFVASLGREGIKIESLACMVETTRVD